MRALTYSVCMNHTKTQELLLVPINILEAAHLLLLIVLVLLVVLIVLLLFRRKHNKTLSHGPKTPLVACVFHLVSICTSFWLNENRYTCFWQLPFILIVSIANDLSSESSRGDVSKAELVGTDTAVRRCC